MNFKKAINWIESRWGDDGLCPMCGESDWTVNKELGALAGQMDARRHVDFSQAIPIVVAWCQNCGFIAMLNASTMGLA